jgi:hypothetical protein
VPCLLYYTRVDLNDRVPVNKVVSPITDEVLFADNPLERYVHETLHTPYVDTA